MHGVKKERKSCSQDFLLLTQCRKELVFNIGKSVMNRNSKITIMTLLSFFERAIFLNIHFFRFQSDFIKYQMMCKEHLVEEKVNILMFDQNYLLNQLLNKEENLHSLIKPFTSKTPKIKVCNIQDLLKGIKFVPATFSFTIFRT